MSMLSTDPVADMLSRIRNAALVGKHQVTVPHSKLKETIARQLVKVNYLREVSVDGEGVNKHLLIVINDEGANCAFTELSRISTPGRRVYAKSNAIPRIKNGRGTVIVSTSKGVMDAAEARQKRLGGELICKVY